MSAGPQVLPVSKRRSGRSTPAVPGYQPDSSPWCAKERAATYVDPGDPKGRLKGWTPLPHAWYADIGRITKGHHAQAIMLPYFLSYVGGRSKTVSTTGRTPEDVAYTPGETSDLDIEQVAQACDCTIRNAWEELEQLAARVIPVLEYRKTAPGKFRVHLFTERWREIPDASGIPKKPVESADEAQPEPEQDAAQAAKERTVLTKKPVTIRRGQAWQSPPITCGVQKLKLQNDTPQEFSLEAVVQAGELLLVARSAAGAPVVVPTEQATRPPVVPSPARQPSGKPQSNDINNLRSKNGTPVPKTLSEPAAELRDRLTALQLWTNDAHWEELAGYLPAGCTPEVAAAVVAERVNRPGAKKFQAAMLSVFFLQDIPAKWEGFRTQRSGSSQPGKVYSEFAERLAAKAEKAAKKNGGGK